MGIQARVEKNPIIYLVCSTATVTAIAVGIVLYLANWETDLLHSRHQLELESQEAEYKQLTDDFEFQLGSIQRRMGDETERFDIRTVKVSTEDLAKVVPHSHYFDDEQFYARLPKAGHDWTYIKTTEADYAAEITGKDPNEFEMLPLTTHLWQSNRVYKIERSRYKKLSPAILVQTIPHKTALGLILGAAFTQWVFSDSAPKSIIPKRIQDHMDFLEEYYLKDPIGIILTSELIEATIPNREFTEVTVLKSLARKQDVVYARLESTLKDVVVDGTPYKEFYLIREFILVSTPSHLYFVRILLPTPDHLNVQDLAWTNAWLATFAIPVSR